MISTLSCRRLLAALGAAVALLLPAAHGHAEQLAYKVGPAPAWVIPVAPASASRKPNSAVGGIDALLSDMQTRIDATGKTTFVHLASKALASGGVDRAGNIAIAFEPTYQKLTLHTINLVRDGRVIDKLGSARIQVLQRETELEYRIYDGRKTVNVDLDDLRVGDIVEYSYSVSGHNPVFGNKVSGHAALQYNVPLDRIFLRVMTPSNRPLRFENRNTGLQPELVEAGGYRDYRWNLIGMPGLSAEKDAPEGFDPQASVAWTEFADWSSVVRWALPLYRQPAALGPALKAEVARIAAASQAPSERLRAVLRLAQRDIRYLGVEIGASTHAPAAPDVVFQRRFGDCKDKAMLVVAMLGALGIEAAPALVHTDRLAAGAQPTPHAFNHVIVRARVDGATYWLDPTRPEQQGDLAHLYQPDFGMALVLAEGVDDGGALVPMAPRSRAPRTVRSRYDSSAGFDQPVGYAITTTMRGEAADRMRAQLATRGTAAWELDYLNYYARTYPAIKLARALAISDDLRTNTFTVSEAYTIADFWQRQGASKRRQGYIRSSDIAARLNAPSALNRVAPLKIEHPDDIEETTEIKLPEQWDDKPERVEVTNPAFEFTHTSARSADRRTILITDRYRSLADRVEPAAMAVYAANLRSAADEVGVWLYRGDSTAKPTIRAHADWRAVLAMVLFFAAVLFSLLMHTSPEGHRGTDLKLLFGFVGIAVALVLSTMLIAKNSHIVLALLATLYVVHVVIGRISIGAPASHWIYPLSHPQVASVHPVFFSVLVRVLRWMPALLVIACAVLLAIDVAA